MLHRHLVLAFAVLTACSPGEPAREEPSAAGPSTAAPAAVAAAAPSPDSSPLASDLRILGTEPFWAINISKTDNTAAFSRPSEADIAFGFPTESPGPDGAFVLTSTSSQGDAVMTLRKQDCSDGMSDRNYPWAAEVVFKGETLRGCAATPEFIAQTPQ
jgi:uncharacterized membrane protein